VLTSGYLAQELRKVLRYSLQKGALRTAQEEVVTRKHTQHERTASLLPPRCKFVVAHPFVLPTTERKDGAVERLASGVDVRLVQGKVQSQNRKKAHEFGVSQNRLRCGAKATKLLNELLLGQVMNDRIPAGYLRSTTSRDKQVDQTEVVLPAELTRKLEADPIIAPMMWPKKA